MNYTCKVCKYRWTPRPKRLEQGRQKPVKCPFCLSPRWDESK